MKIEILFSLSFFFSFFLLLKNRGIFLDTSILCLLFNVVFIGNKIISEEIMINEQLRICCRVKIEFFFSPPFFFSFSLLLLENRGIFLDISILCLLFTIVFIGNRVINKKILVNSIFANLFSSENQIFLFLSFPFFYFSSLWRIVEFSWIFLFYVYRLTLDLSVVELFAKELRQMGYRVEKENILNHSR